MKKFTDLLQLIRVFSHNHGDGLRKPIQLMDLKVDSTGLTNQQPKKQL
jgi:hypothetical protein